MPPPPENGVQGGSPGWVASTRKVPAGSRQPAWVTAFTELLISSGGMCSTCHAQRTRTGPPAARRVKRIRSRTCGESRHTVWRHSTCHCPASPTV